MRAVYIAFCASVFLGCHNPQQSLVKLALSGDPESLRALLQREVVCSFADEEMAARHDLWVYLAARRGLFSAAVCLEQRAFGLIRHHRSPKEEFRRQLEHIRPSEQEIKAGFGEFVRYLQLVIDGDMAKADDIKKKLTRLGIDSLNQCEEEYLSSEDSKTLMPYAYGVTNIWSDENPPNGNMDRIAFYIPSCVYVPWSTSNANYPTRIPVDMEFLISPGEQGINRKELLPVGQNGKLILELRPNSGKYGAEKHIDIQGLLMAIERVFDRYGMGIGSDVRIAGVKAEARSAMEIAGIVQKVIDANIKAYK
jgi:hypothetical protein